MVSEVIQYISGDDGRKDKPKARAWVLSPKELLSSSREWLSEPMRRGYMIKGTIKDYLRSREFTVREFRGRHVYAYLRDVSLVSDSQIANVSGEEKFTRLVTTWKKETAHLSSAVQQAMHPAYQQIIGMGTLAVPLILRELEKEPNHWFWALAAITGENPVAPAHVGRVTEMTQDWISWGRARGHI